MHPRLQVVGLGTAWEKSRPSRLLTHPSFTFQQKSIALSSSKQTHHKLSIGTMPKKKQFLQQAAGSKQKANPAGKKKQPPVSHKTKVVSASPTFCSRFRDQMRAWT